MPQRPGMKVGFEVAQLRRSLGLSQREVCDVWGRKQAVLSRIENNQRGMMPERLDELKLAIHEAAQRKGTITRG